MKKNDLAEIKKMEDKALLEKVVKLKSELKGLILDKSMNKLSNLKQIKHKRKDLAQILTVFRQKELINELEENK